MVFTALFFYKVHKKFTRSISRDLFQSFEPRASRRFSYFEFQISIETCLLMNDSVPCPWVCVCLNLSRIYWTHARSISFYWNKFCINCLRFNWRKSILVSKTRCNFRRCSVHSWQHSEKWYQTLLQKSQKIHQFFTLIFL